MGVVSFQVEEAYHQEVLEVAFQVVTVLNHLVVEEASSHLVVVAYFHQEVGELNLQEEEEPILLEGVVLILQEEVELIPQEVVGLVLQVVVV